jgi:hypothetical protein
MRMAIIKLRTYKSAQMANSHGANRSRNAPGLQIQSSHAEFGGYEANLPHAEAMISESNDLVSKADALTDG